MRFGVLGPLAVWTADGTPVKIPELKVRALLADLLVHDGGPVSADRLADDLWGDEPPGNPTNTLQAKVSQLRRALEQAEPGGRELVAYQSPGYLLRIDADAVDANRFEAMTTLALATDDPRARAALLADALALWRGPAYADFADEPFTLATITRLEEARLVALEEQAEARLALGEHGRLAGELGDLVARHPLRERLRAAQLRALYRAGRQSEALASYADLRDRLAEELGLDPGPELVALQAAILRQDPELDPTPAATRPRTNLPAPLTDLVGRAGAVREVRSLLGTGRLVTLTGSGGVGKTRLAVEVATRLVDAFPDGAWLVELAALGRGAADGVDAPAEAVMAVLGIREDAAPIDRLADVLSTRQVLLVLDNCEHVVAPVAELAELLLRAAPGLRILATSQEPLGLAGEVLAAVAPLEHTSAVRLFVARAAAAAPGFALGKDNAGPVAELCQRLDGIPLALELAATRVRALGVAGLVARLDDRFRLLAAGYRGAPARQRTLRATIDWSWDLLTGPERIVLRRLAVHADGCTLEAAEEVCAGHDLPAAEVLDLLARLVDRSLVVMTDGPGGARYRLLESVAEYCLERLADAAESESVRERHNHYYVALAERAESQLRGHDQREWLERLDADAANLRGALDGAVRAGDAGLALRLVNAMAWYWFLRGRLGEARRSLAAALAVDGNPSGRASAVAWQDGITLLAGEAGAAPDRYDDIDDPGRRARAEWFLGFARSDFGDQTVSEDLVSRALATFRELDDRWGTASALSTAAKQAMIRGDLAAVRRNGEQSLALFRELGDRWGQLQATEWLGALAEVAGDYEQGTRLHRDGVALAEELGLWPQAADRLSWLGRISMLLGDYPQARELLERGMRLAAEQGYRPGQVFAEIGLGLAARREGKLDVAETHLRSALEWCGGDGDPAAASILAELGFIAEQRGDAEDALAIHLDGFARARQLGDPRGTALALEGLAGAAALAGDHHEAARLLGEAAALRESAGAPLAPAERGDVDRITRQVSAALGD